MLQIVPMKPIVSQDYCCNAWMGITVMQYNFPIDKRRPYWKFIFVYIFVHYRHLLLICHFVVNVVRQFVVNDILNVLPNANHVAFWQWVMSSMQEIAFFR